MLLLQNIEGDSYNPIVDNYLVVKVINYADTAFNELQSLLDLVAKSHVEPLKWMRTKSLERACRVEKR